MTERLPTIDRAFQLAKSGECSGVGQIRDRLKAEGYPREEAQITGKTFRAQLRKICETAQRNGGAAPTPEDDVAV